MKHSAQNRNSAAEIPRISIAMATCNGDKFIREQLDSIARQTLLPIEIVITDDCSTDSTLQVIEDFSRNAPFPVRVFPNETRLGYSDNFFRAASLCTGDVIAFCDQDDIWLENKLTTCAQFFADPSVSLVAHSACVFLESGERTHRRPFYRQTRILKPTAADPFAFPFGFATLIRRELLQVALPPVRPQKIAGHDQWFWLLATSVGKTATIAEPLALYRQHQGNVFGAGQRPEVSHQAINIIRTLEYDRVADAELECSRSILQVAERTTQFSEPLRAVAKNIARRSELHRIRTRIYRKDSTFAERTLSFARIFFRKGYFPDPSGTSLGPRAAMKDLIFGVSGFFRIAAANRSAFPN